jgi:hypothetical protein
MKYCITVNADRIGVAADPARERVTALAGNVVNNVFDSAVFFANSFAQPIERPARAPLISLPAREAITATIEDC